LCQANIRSIGYTRECLEHTRSVSYTDAISVEYTCACVEHIRRCSFFARQGLPDMTDPVEEVAEGGRDAGGCGEG